MGTQKKLYHFLPETALQLIKESGTIYASLPVTAQDAKINVKLGRGINDRYVSFTTNPSFSDGYPLNRNKRGKDNNRIYVDSCLEIPLDFLEKNNFVSEEVDYFTDVKIKSGSGLDKSEKRSEKEVRVFPDNGHYINLRELSKINTRYREHGEGMESPGFFTPGKKTLVGKQLTDSTAELVARYLINEVFPHILDAGKRKELIRFSSIVEEYRQEISEISEILKILEKRDLRSLMPKWCKDLQVNQPTVRDYWNEISKIEKIGRRTLENNQQIQNKLLEVVREDQPAYSVYAKLKTVNFELGVTVTREVQKAVDTVYQRYVENIEKAKEKLSKAIEDIEASIELYGGQFDNTINSSISAIVSEIKNRLQDVTYSGEIDLIIKKIKEELTKDMTREKWVKMIRGSHVKIAGMDNKIKTRRLLAQRLEDWALDGAGDLNLLEILHLPSWKVDTI